MELTTRFGHERGLEKWAPRLVVAGMVAMFALTALWDLANQRRVIAQSSADTDVAAITGPPCPVLSRADYQRKYKDWGPLPYVFDFNGESFGRYFGYADCSVAEAKGSMGLGAYNVCQFTSPAVLYVKTNRGEFYFTPGVGRKASVLAPDGQVSCVMAAPAETD